MDPRYSMSNHPLGVGGSCFIIIYLCQSTPTLAGLKLVYFIFQYSLCARIHICVKIQVSHEKASFVFLSCTISLSTAFCSKRELRPASFIFARHPTATATKKSPFTSSIPVSRCPPFEEFGDQLPPLATLPAGPFSKDLIRFLITTRCAIGFLISATRPATFFPSPSKLPVISCLLPSTASAIS